MVFKSGWTKGDIESLTYREIFHYVQQYDNIKIDELLESLKCFAIYNCESSAVAYHGKKGAVRKYVNDILRRKIDPDMEDQSHIENQFKDVDFGE